MTDEEVEAEYGEGAYTRRNGDDSGWHTNDQAGFDEMDSASQPSDSAIDTASELNELSEDEANDRAREENEHLDEVEEGFRYVKTKKGWMIAVEDESGDFVPVEWSKEDGQYVYTGRAAKVDDEGNWTASRRPRARA
jgi:hypothetical protein